MQVCEPQVATAEARLAGCRVPQENGVHQGTHASGQAESACVNRSKASSGSCSVRQCVRLRSRPETVRRRVHEPSAVYWGVNFPIERLPNAREIGAEAAVQIAVGLLRTWAPRLRTVVAAADLSTVGTTPISRRRPGGAPHTLGIGHRHRTRRRRVCHAPDRWPRCGDAIRDADLLATHLAEAAKGLTTIPLAVHEYERGLATYATEAVRVSMVPIVWQKRMPNPLLGLAARAGLAIGAPIVKAFR
ncbi:hypothetical protein ACIP4S_28055 [Streptomyces chartreusis]|uniref:hypothetical protein n=1 Tax=Streptomyces chartreusis TaxID=1969 RepID=UPI0037F5955A